MKLKKYNEFIDNDIYVDVDVKKNGGKHKNRT